MTYHVVMAGPSRPSTSFFFVSEKQDVNALAQCLCMTGELSLSVLTQGYGMTKSPHMHPPTCVARRARDRRWARVLQVVR